MFRVLASPFSSFSAFLLRGIFSNPCFLGWEGPSAFPTFSPYRFRIVDFEDPNDFWNGPNCVPDPFGISLVGPLKRGWERGTQPGEAQVRGETCWVMAIWRNLGEPKFRNKKKQGRMPHQKRTTLNIFWGKFSPPRETWVNDIPQRKSSLRGLIFPSK